MEHKSLTPKQRKGEEEKYSTIVVHAQNRTLGDNPQKTAFNDSFQDFQRTVHRRMILQFGLEGEMLKLV